MLPKLYTKYISRGLLLAAPSTSAEEFTGVFARKNALRFLARNGRMPPLTQRERRVLYDRRRAPQEQDTGRYPRWSRVWPLNLVPPSSLSRPSLHLQGARIRLSPSHEVTYRDARCFTTWTKLSHQVVTRTLPFLPSFPLWLSSSSSIKS